MEPHIEQADDGRFYLVAENRETARVAAQLRAAGCTMSREHGLFCARSEAVARQALALLTASTPVTGNTFPVKDQLRAAGCRWDAGRKTWMADTPEIAARAAEIMRAAPAPKPRHGGNALTAHERRDRATVRRNYERTGDYYGSGMYDLES